MIRRTRCLSRLHSSAPSGVTIIGMTLSLASKLAILDWLIFVVTVLVAYMTAFGTNFPCVPRTCRLLHHQKFRQVFPVEVEIDVEEYNSAIVFSYDKCSLIFILGTYDI